MKNYLNYKALDIYSCSFECPHGINDKDCEFVKMRKRMNNEDIIDILMEFDDEKIDDLYIKHNKCIIENEK